MPYYAGSRVVTYRTDLFKKAGITKLPATTAQYVADAKKLLAKNPKKGFSPVYIAGTDWYVAMSFVFDYGGGIAQQVSGKWKGLLNSPKSIAGLTAYKNFFLATSRASKTTDETHPNPYDVYAQGQAASMIGPSWFTCCVGKKYTASTAQFVMPGHVKGQAIPGFLGGSDLAVPATSSNKALASDWIKDFTSTSSREGPAGEGQHPERDQPARLERQRAGRAHGAGSSRRRSTGSTSRTATSSATCWRRSSPASCRSSRQLRRPATTSHRC